MKRLVLLCLLLSLGGYARLHLGAMQVVAWSGMIVVYARTVSLPEAIEMTFDGEHPCSLCKRVSAAASEANPDLTAPSCPQPDLLLAETGHSWIQNPLLLVAAPLDTAIPESAAPLRPPVPPPRDLV